MNQQIRPQASITKRLLPIAVIGVLVSLYLLHHHLEVKFGYIVGKSICNINQYFDCDSVAKSSFSELFGIPVALLGLAFYVSVSFLFYFFRTDRKTLEHVLLLFGTIALIPVAILASLSLFGLGKVCLFCAFVYIISITLFLVAYLENKNSGTFLSRLSYGFNQLTNPDQRSHTMPWLISSIAVFIFFLVIQPLYVDLVLRERYLSYFDKSVLGKLVAAWQTTEVLFGNDEISKISGVISVYPKGNNPSLKNKISIVEFSDLECPFCQKVAPILERIYEKHNDVVELHLLNFPLDMGCNPSITRKMHENACALAEIVTAKALEDVGAAYKMHKRIMEDQLDHTFDFKKFEAQHSKTQMAKDSVLSQIQAGIKFGVQGTPAIFINGKRVFYDNFFQVEPVIDQIIEQIREGKN